MSGKRDYLKNLPRQDEFSHWCACWAQNHRGWAKMKKANRRRLNKKMRREAEREVMQK